MYIQFDYSMRDSIQDAAAEWFAMNITPYGHHPIEEKGFFELLANFDDSEDVMEKVAEEMAIWFENDIEVLLSDYWDRHQDEFKKFFIKTYDELKKLKEEDEEYE